MNQPDNLTLTRKENFMKKTATKKTATKKTTTTKAKK